MLRKSIMFALAACVCTVALGSDTLKVTSFRYQGPVAIQKPHFIDTVDNNGKSFSMKDLLSAPTSFLNIDSAPIVSSLGSSDEEALHLLGFSLQNSSYAIVNVNVKGVKDYKLYLEGKPVKGSANLEPGTHAFMLKCLSKGETPEIGVVTEKGGPVTIREDGRKIFSLDINSQGEDCGGISISPSGRYVALRYSTVLKDGKREYRTEVIQLAEGKNGTNKVVIRTRDRISWMPRSDAYWFTRKDANGTRLVSVTPDNGEETILASDIPSGQFTIAPTEDYLIYTIYKDGPKEGEVHQILVPDDRQPGWRNRCYIAKYDLASGIMQPLTFGYHNSWLCDISDDGSKLVFMTERQRLTKRPTTLRSIYEMDLRTLAVDCLVEDDGFISSASYSPDGTQLLVTGSPESFEGVGKNVKEGQIPNGYDNQIYLFNIAQKSARPLSYDFAPSVSNSSWSRFDGRIYLSCEDKDCVSLYRLDPASGKYEKLPAEEDRVASFDLAVNAPSLVYYGQGLENTNRAYLMNAWKLKQELLHDFSATRLADTDLGRGNGYEFTSSRGDLINCFYVLPPDFDSSKKYPMLVHYYGGCSPTSRYCVGSYSPQYYAAQGYVFLAVNPSGAAGFGQEFAARHVNTAGDVVADDIIEAVQRFSASHSYVDTDHIGCFSASYGGFMTQLLLSKTDIFAAGISHAGISDHTSYWGEGYWGYSYSEVSMADSYPWTRKDLYVDRSPLYNADKIHSPLLFLHGSADTNVPIGESIQMFTALKLLGQDTAFVVLDGENHGVQDYAKRREWLRTISAWFAKYLKEDSTWWNELYPEKNL